MQSCLFRNQASLSYSLSRGYIIGRNTYKVDFCLVTLCVTRGYVYGHGVPRVSLPVRQIRDLHLSEAPSARCRFRLALFLSAFEKPASWDTPPGLNPTSDRFILRECWGSTKQLKPWTSILDVFVLFPLPRLDCILTFIYIFFTCYISNDEMLCPYRALFFPCVGNQMLFQVQGLEHLVNFPS